MNRKRLAVVVFLSFALTFGLSGMTQGPAYALDTSPYSHSRKLGIGDTSSQLQLNTHMHEPYLLEHQVENPATEAKTAKTSYPNMAPLDQYLMSDRNAEISLARSAAPEAISRDARILVLGRHGYETAVEGKNGFVCVVERAWMSPSDAPGFWNPKLRGPICFNPPAARSVLPATYKRTELALAGRTKAEIIEGNKTAFEKGELPPLEPGAMSYMMSKEAYLTDDGDHNLAHLMFYAPPLDGKVWGADVSGSPVMLIPQFKGVQPIDVFIVPVGRWSDGTPAPVM